MTKRKDKRDVCYFFFFFLLLYFFFLSCNLSFYGAQEVLINWNVDNIKNAMKAVIHV